ncbi:MAG: chromosome segregation protein SMC [archaeon]
MTLIQKIVMRGFKSFALKTELLFGNRFNVILGPNGSGKSNVLDALCFVLGKSSTKGLRAEKSANLIYNGGKSKNPAKDGEVSIFFDNSKQEFPTEDSVIKITRVVKGSGQSVYKINDKTRTRQQILDLMSHANINPDGYNIILQGDIIRFVEMSAIDRRLIVEEIAGISVYEDKKEKALRELNKVEEKLNEAEIIMKERETHLKELKNDRDQALRYKDIDSKKKENKASLLDIQIKARKERIESLTSEIGDNEAKAKNVAEEIGSLRKDIEAKRAEIRQISTEIEEKGEKSQVRLHKEVEQLRVDTATNKTRISSCENEIARMASRKDQLHNTLSELEEKIEKLQSEKNTLDADKESRIRELEKLELRIKGFRKDKGIDSAGDVEKEVDRLEAEAEEQSKGVQKLREEQQNMLREKDQIEYQLRTVDEKIEKVAEIEKAHKSELSSLKKKKQDFRDATLELNKRLTEDSGLAAKLAEARERLLKTREELSALKTRSIGIKESIAGSTAVKKILDMRTKFGGIHNTVSNLGSVSSRYALALEIAAGPRLNSIVVQNDEVAAKCIKFLKTNKLGIATFLPLNKMKAKPIEPEVTKLAKANGVVDFAVNLVSYESKFRSVFSYVFGNTLIVQDIDVARRLGIGSARMVTLDGDMCETSGAMHGGFRKRGGLGFQEKEIVASMDDSEKRVAELEDVVCVYQKKREENEAAIDRLRKEKAELEGEIIKAEKSLHLGSEDLDYSLKLKEELGRKLALVDERLSAVQMKVSSLNKIVAKLKMQKQELRAKISHLRNPTLLAELNTFEQKRDQVKDAINSITGEIKNIAVQIDTILKPELENTHKILKQLEREELSFADEIKALKDKIKVQNKQLAEKEKSEKEFYAKFKQLFTKRNKITDDIQKIEKTIMGREEQARNIEKKTNLLSLDNAKYKAELAGFEEEFKPYAGVKLNRNKSEEQLKKELWQFERTVEQMGAVNMRALEIYERVEEEYGKLIRKKEKLLLEKEDVLGMMGEIESKKKELFLHTFDKIAENFKRIFSSLSTKGDATLYLENPEKPFEEGVRIKVRIAGKKFLDIRSLSGGEKTMTALSFIFSIQEHNPASFYVLDEVDAALDKRNSEKLAKLVAKYSDNAQYIMISHNDSIISEADNLYGVSMNEHTISKVVSLKI